MKTILLSALAVAIALLPACKGKTVVKPERKEIIEAVYASGFVVSKNEYKLYALGDGYITQQLKKTGDAVKAGDAVYVIQSEAQQARYSAANAAYQFASGNAKDNSASLQELANAIGTAQLKFQNDSLSFARSKNMFEQNVINRNEFDKVQLAFNVSKNDLQNARERYRKTKDQLAVEAKNAQSSLQAAATDAGNYTLKSIINGMVYETYKEVGEIVRKNDLVALLGDKEEKVLQLSVDQQDIEKVKVGQEVLVKIDVTGNKIYKAVVTKVYPAMNQNEQSFRVDATFEKGFNVNFTRTSVEANIVIAKKESALVLQRKVISADNKVKVKGGSEVQLELGIGNLAEVEVLKGLSGGEEIELIEQK